MKLEIIINGYTHYIKGIDVVPNIGDSVKVGSETYRVKDRTIEYSMSGNINKVKIIC